MKNVRIKGKDGGRAFYAIFALLLLFHLWLMWQARIYPFVDLPNHLAKATIYRYYEEPDNRFAEFYRIDAFPKPNVFHLIFTGSRLFSSVESANRLLLCLYVILLPLIVLMIIRKLGGSPWAAMLSFLCLYNLNMCWGFVDYAVAIPVLLMWFHTLIDRHRRRNVLNGAALSLLFLLLFVMHAIAALFSLMIFWTYCIYRYRASPRKLVAETLLGLPLVGMLIAWWNTAPDSGTGIASFLADYYTNEYPSSILARGRHLLTFDNLFLFEGLAGNILSALFSACIVLLFIYAVLRGRRSTSVLHTGSALSWILLSGAAICFFLLPPRIPGNVLLYERFSVLVLIAMIILAGALHSEERNRALKAFICALSLVYSAAWAEYFLEFGKENESFTREFLAESAGGTLVGLMYDAYYRGQPVYVHFPNYNIVWNRAITATSVIDYRFGSVGRASGFESLPRYDEWIGAGERAWWPEYSVFDYVLVRGVLPKGAVESLLDYTPIKHAGKWSLYRKPHGSTPSDRTPSSSR